MKNRISILLSIIYILGAFLLLNTNNIEDESKNAPTPSNANCLFDRDKLDTKEIDDLCFTTDFITLNLNALAANKAIDIKEENHIPAFSQNLDYQFFLTDLPPPTNI